MKTSELLETMPAGRLALLNKIGIELETAIADELSDIEGATYMELMPPDTNDYNTPMLMIKHEVPAAGNVDQALLVHRTLNLVSKAIERAVKRVVPDDGLLPVEVVIVGTRLDNTLLKHLVIKPHSAINEGRLLDTMGKEFLKAFMLTEESHYEEIGVVKPYSIGGRSLGEKYFIQMTYRPVQGRVADKAQVEHWDKSTNGLVRFVNEFFADDILKPDIVKRRTVSVFSLSLSMPKLDESQAVPSFIENVAEQVMIEIERRIKEEAAYTVTLEMRPSISGGVVAIGQYNKRCRAHERDGAGRIIREVLEYMTPEDALHGVEGFIYSNTPSSINIRFKHIDG